MEAVVEPSASFWQGKRVFLTGHTGFKGTWLATWLDLLGASVAGYALEPEEHALYPRAAPIGDLESVIADVRDPGALAEAVTAFAPDVVFHLAAQPLVLESYRTPRETFEVNVLGTVNLLEAVRACPGVRSVVIVTTDKCYENREWPWPYRESDALGGRDPYSASKAAAEIAAASYRASFFDPERHGGAHRTAVATARSGNVIGGGDFAEDRLVPDLVRAAMAGKPAAVRNPDSVRPWQHVLEPTAGYLVLAERLVGSAAYADGWNFGPFESECRSVRWVCEEVASLWDGLSLAFPPPAGPHEARTLRLDVSKATTELGWRPRWTTREAVRETISTYRALAASEAPARELLEDCIRRYTEARGIPAPAARDVG